MSSQLASALQKLAAFRAQSSRQSQEIVDAGVLLLAKKSVKNPDAETCAWLEQLALAAIDVGRLDIADVRDFVACLVLLTENMNQDCILLLKGNFKDSLRVDVLVGIRKEASQSPETVLEYYDNLLENDESNAVRCFLDNLRTKTKRETKCCFQGCLEAQDHRTPKVGRRAEGCGPARAIPRHVLYRCRRVA